MDWLKKNVPILGGLVGDGAKSSEGVGFAGLFAWCIAGTMTMEKAIAVAGMAIGLGVYALARSGVKAEAVKA